MNIVLENSPLNSTRVVVPVKSQAMVDVALPVNANNHPQNQTTQIMQVFHDSATGIISIIRNGTTVTLPNPVGNCILSPGDAVVLADAQPNNFLVIPLW